MVAESSSLANHRGLFIYFDKPGGVYQPGGLATGTVSLELQEPLEIIGKSSYCRSICFHVSLHTQTLAE